MTPEHIQLIQSTVPVLREHGVALTRYFYARMLKQHPELKHIFNQDHQQTGRQPRALAAAVLAYAEHIEHPEKLAKAVERITSTHVRLDIQPEHYAIVGEHLLHSISEVLNVPFESELILAWQQAYQQLADLLICVEQEKYHQLAAQPGGWAGWREFKIVDIHTDDEGKIFSVAAVDTHPLPDIQIPSSVTVRVNVPELGLKQPEQFPLHRIQPASHVWAFKVKTPEDAANHHVADRLLNAYQVGDELHLSAPI